MVLLFCSEDIEMKVSVIHFVENLTLLNDTCDPWKQASEVISSI